MKVVGRVASALILTSCFRIVQTLSYLPLSTSGRWMLDNAGRRVTYAGTNWPGHLEAMIPEGLQYQSIPSIVSKIKSLGMNSVRLTYATEMVDDIYQRGSDMTMQASLVNALGQRNGIAIFNKIVANHPGLFTAATTRLQVFDAVAAECERQNVMVHLDNHISKAMWCCNTQDGNSWFGDTYFDPNKWRRGWQFMANHTKSWSAIASVGLRNELRSPDNNPQLKARNYQWADWYNNMKSCTDAVHAANPNLVIFLSGLGYDTDLSPIVKGSNLGKGVSFRLSNFPINKMALELHNYQGGATNCNSLVDTMRNSGWSALSNGFMPVVMTEFGFNQNPETARSVYATCVKDFFMREKAGWMVWVLSGSYYIRQGTQDLDEKWGLLSHDWASWRSASVIQNYIIPMVQGTLR